MTMFNIIFSTISSTICEYPFTSAFCLLYFGLIWAFHKWDRIVVDFPAEVPGKIRTVAGHRLPPDYPNGWIPILESDEIGPNQLKSVIILGRELVIARSADRKIYVFDAYCPHLGANLSVGGTVHKDNCNRDCVRCPFHGWSFRMTDGHCTDIPYEETPNSAKLKVWHSKEINNIIFVWHHSDNCTPDWSIVPIDKIISGEWIYRCKTKHYINCHIQDIPENGPDVAHLNEIHADSFALGSDLSFSRRFKHYAQLFGHEWSAEWRQRSAPESHIADVKLIHRSKFFGMNILTMFLDVNQIGPAYVELRYRTTFFGGISGIIVQQVQPIGHLRNCIIHHIYTESGWFGYIFAKFLMFSEAKLLERDIQIWNRKAFLSKPHFAKSERSLLKYRRWYSQFYSNKSIDW